jgi:DNA-binding NarL/FixJ family response regulator
MLQRHPSVAVLADPRDVSPASVSLVRRALPGVPLVAVLQGDRDAEATALVQAGVAGVVLEPSFDETFALVVRAVAVGLTAVPRKLRRATSAARLTRREREILGLVALGLTNEDIAGRLFLSESTVKGHLTTAFRRLGVRSRAEAAALTAEFAVATPEGER